VKCWELEPAPDLYRFVLSTHTQADVDRMARQICPPGLRSQGWLTEPYVLLAYLKERLFSLELLPPIGLEARPITSAAPRRNSYETDEHILLKDLAAEWLTGRGVAELDYEGGYEGGEFDVAAKDRSWVVECGGSRASKVYQFLPHSPTAKLVFFNRVGIAVFTAGRPELVAEYLRLRDDLWGATIRSIPPLM
jgi:hypothetical protein